MRVTSRFAGPALVLLVASSVVGAAHLGGLRLNLTPSIPRGVYLFRSGDSENGSLVAACLPLAQARFGRRRGYLGSGRCPGRTAPVLKLVGAREGEIVEVLPAGILVNGEYLQPAPPIEDRSGRPLETYSFGRHKLGPNEVWLYSPSPHSWDSRFFGPVLLQSVLGRVRPIWTWGRCNAFSRESPSDIR